MEKKKELLKKIREFMILNLEIKKLSKELGIYEIHDTYEEVTKLVREPNKRLYKMLYDAVMEIEYEEFGGKKRKEIPWFPKINYEKCKNCKKCVEFCPKGVYDIENGKVVVKYPYNCIINCNACSYMCCENNAIIFPKNKIEKLDSDRL
ncbi:ATP-binding protein [Methanocaldococcus sp.]